MTEPQAAGLGDKPGAALPGFAAIELRGPETDKFLQGQLTVDVERLVAGRWTWGGHCSPQGRLLCTFLAWRTSSESVVLTMAEDLSREMAARLSMYKLRAKTEIVSLATKFSGLLESDAAPPDGETVAHDRSLLLGLGGKMALVAGKAGGSDNVQGASGWLAEFAGRGFPWISAPVKDQLIPQMASLDLAGGVSFTKGCYVGQEIVSRIRHRGRIKRRAYILRGKGAAPLPGTNVHACSHGGQAVGQIIFAAGLGSSFVSTGSVRLDAAGSPLALSDGRVLQCAPPPYGLEERPAAEL